MKTSTENGFHLLSADGIMFEEVFPISYDFVAYGASLLKGNKRNNSVFVENNPLKTQ